MKQFKRHPEKETNAEEGHYYISISDLMTSILFIFIMILTYVMLSFVQKEDELSNEIRKIEQNIKYRAELLQFLQSKLREKDIDVEIDIENGNLRLKSDLLFGSGSAVISEEGKRQIGEIAKLLNVKMVEPKYQGAIDTIFIEGHTDTARIKATSGHRDFWSNKELSAQRAINTYAQMEQATEKSIKELKNNKGNYVFSYSGYAATRPLCDESNETIAEDNKRLRKCRAKNRRIEFYFTINTPDIDAIRVKIDE